MTRATLLAAIAGVALLAAPLGAEAQTYRPLPPRYGPGPVHPAAGFGFGYRRRPYARYGYRRVIRAAAAAVGYGIGYGYGAGYGRSYGYGAGYGQSYGYGAGYGQSYGYSTRSTPYASGPYAPQPTGQCGCSPTAYQTTTAYVPVTTYKAVRVYYAPQQQPYYNVPPYAQQ